MKKLLILLAIFIFASHTNAQNSNFSVLPTVGITKPLIDAGVGIHVGVNPSYKLVNWFAIEGQVSYIYTNIFSTFLSGYKGSFKAGNFLAGGRLYLNPNAKNTLFYLNLLAGLKILKEVSNGIARETEYGLGASLGGFVEYRRITLGLTFDSPQNSILKLGYAFNNRTK